MYKFIHMNIKMIITGDTTQIDLPHSQRSGLVEAMHILKNVNDIAFVELSKKDIVRHKLVSKIVEAYDHYDKKQHTSKKKGHKKEESPTPIFSDLQGLGDN